MNNDYTQPSEAPGTLTMSWPPEPLPPRPLTIQQLKGWCQVSGSSGTLLQPTLLAKPALMACVCVSRAAETKSHTPGDLNRRKYSPTALKVRSLRARCQQGWFPPALRRLCPGPSPHPAALLTIFDVPWLVDTAPPLCLHPHMAFSLCACLSVSRFPLFIRKPVILT